MELTYRLLTPAGQWPDDPASLAAAIRTQGPFDPAVHVEQDMLVIEDAGAGLRTTARLRPYEAQSYEALLTADSYAPRMTDRDRDTALPFQHEVAISTAPHAGTPEETQALFHATTADGIWWLMGGFLADPDRRTVWGWRRGRGDQPLIAHAAETAAQLGDAHQGGA